MALRPFKAPSETWLVLMPHSPKPANLLPTAPFPSLLASSWSMSQYLSRLGPSVASFKESSARPHLLPFYPHSVRCSKSISGPYHKVLRLCISHFSRTHLPSLGWNVLECRNDNFDGNAVKFLTARYINSMLLLRFFF